MPDDQIPNLRGGYGATFIFMASLVGPILAVAGILWKAAQYPDRTEFRPVVNDVSSIKMDLAVYKAQNEGRLATIEAQGKTTNEKLDRLLEEGRKGRGR
jgi:hypothetical protein